jgi:hypothetical protein
MRLLQHVISRSFDKLELSYAELTRSLGGRELVMIIDGLYQKTAKRHKRGR